MDTRKVIAIGVALLVIGGAAFADTGDGVKDRLDNRGDRIEDRLDARGDRIDRRLDRKGDRIDRRLDRKGEKIDRRLDRRGGHGLQPEQAGRDHHS